MSNGVESINVGDLLNAGVNAGVVIAGVIGLWRMTRSQITDLKNDMHRGEQRLKQDMSQMEVRLTDRISHVETTLARPNG